MQVYSPIDLTTYACCNVITPGVPVQQACSDCFFLQPGLILGEDAPLPCLKYVIVDLEALNVAVDWGEIEWSAGWINTDGIAGAWIQDGSKLVILTSNEAIPNVPYRVFYTGLRIETGEQAISHIDVYPFDKCATKTCANCDKCTGDCPGGADLSAGLVVTTGQANLKA